MPALILINFTLTMPSPCINNSYFAPPRAKIAYIQAVPAHKSIVTATINPKESISNVKHKLIWATRAQINSIFGHKLLITGGMGAVPPLTGKLPARALNYPHCEALWAVF